MADRVAVFLDYQNVHLVAAELFAAYGTPAHETIVHPLRVAERVVSKRRGDNELVAVRVYRGRPEPGTEGDQRSCQRRPGRSLGA